MVVALLLNWSAASALCADESEELTATKLEYQVKAGFLFNFAKFVEWPTNAPGAKDVLRVGILDDGGVYSILAGELAGKRIGSKPIEVVRCKRGYDLKQCAIIFMTRAKMDRWPEVKQAVAGTPVLLVGESDQFAARGGCINFVRKGEHIRFEVNLAVAERAGLKISSKLASVAILVRSQEGEK